MPRQPNMGYQTDSDDEIEGNDKLGLLYLY